jgi:hypothetical protein
MGEENDMNISRLGRILALCGTVAVATAIAATPSRAGVQQTRGATAPADFKQEMRRLWVEHVVWTREYVVAAVSNHPGAPAAAARLLKNQDDIGGAVAAFYGRSAGEELTRLLKEHITIAVDVVNAAKAGDKSAYQRADAAWTRNGHDIAEFLSKANPHWPRTALVQMMDAHLATTTQAVVARLNSKWEDDVRAYDAVQTHILHMADALADGIIKQFPARFSDAG